MSTNLSGARDFRDRLSYQCGQRVLNRQVSHCNERAQPVYWYRALVFDSVTAFDVLSFAFPRTNRHEWSHEFSWLILGFWLN